jgi:hypothetical protein
MLKRDIGQELLHAVRGIKAHKPGEQPEDTRTTLRVGPKYFLDGASNAVEVYYGDKRLFRREGLEQVYDPSSRLLRRFASEIEKVEVGFSAATDVNFLEFLPNTSDVWILTSEVRDITGLRHLSTLSRLAIERPTCRMDMLGELHGLKTLYLDDWRPGASSIFGLQKLESIQLRRYPYRDLTRMSKWRNLKALWLTHGSLETLTGIPEGVLELELAGLRKLRDLSGLGACQGLGRLIIEGCPAFSSLAGLEACRELRILSLFNLKSRLQTLAPLRSLQHLSYLFMTDIAGVLQPDDSVLDGLQQLETLIMSKRLGVP